MPFTKISTSSSWKTRNCNAATSAPAGMVTSRRSQISPLVQGVFGVTPGVFGTPNGPGPLFQLPSLNAGRAQSSAGRWVVYRQVTACCRDVGTTSVNLPASCTVRFPRTPRSMPHPSASSFRLLQRPVSGWSVAEGPAPVRKPANPGSYQISVSRCRWMSPALWKRSRISESFSPRMMSFTTLGCSRVVLPAADDGVEDLDQVEHVLVDLAAGRGGRGRRSRAA